MIMLFIALGLILMGGGLLAPGLGAPARLVLSLFGGAFFLLSSAVHLWMGWYRKASANQAFVRTGLGGPKVVLDGGAVVWPLVHRCLDVNLQTMKLGVNPRGRNALITRDNLRADVLAQFYIRVQPDEGHVLAAARSLGEDSVNAQTVENLVSEKLVSALRAIASQMDLFEIHTKRDEFAEKVKEHVRADLEANGLLLESVTISELDQTDPAELSDNNVFDAQGKKKITEITAAALVERNKLERDAEWQRTEKDVQTRELVLDLERKRAEAEASQAAEVSKIKAVRDREAKEKEIQEHQAVVMAEVSQQKAIQEAEILRDQAVTLADRARQIAVAEQEAVRQRAEEGALLAQAERERATQKIVTVQLLAEAEREAEKKLIAAKMDIERSRIADQTSAEVAAFTRVKQATGEQEAACKQAQARLQLAEAEAQALKLVAEGEAAQQMVPVQVDRERVRIKEAEVAVEAQALENRQKFAVAGIELEIQRLRIAADKDVQIAMAQAIGQSLGSSHMTLFGSPEMAANMLQSLAKGMGARSLIDGFLQQDGKDLAQAVGPMLQRLMRATADTNGKSEAH